jgi:hypothetical protein
MRIYLGDDKRHAGPPIRWPGSEKEETKMQKIVRISSLARTLDIIQATLEAGLPPEQQKGAKWALDAVRREYGIPVQEDESPEGEK